jgi:hypothetical protein
MVLLSGSMGSQMFLAGSNDICGLNGDNGSVGVGDESGVLEGSIRVSSSIGVCSVNGSGNAVGGKVSLLSGYDLRGLGGGNGTVGVSNKATSMVGVCAISVSSGVSSVIVSSVISSGISSVVHSVVSVESSVCVRVSSIETLSGKVCVLSGKNLRGLGGGNGTVGVFNEFDSSGSSHASKENQKLHD